MTPAPAPATSPAASAPAAAVGPAPAPRRGVPTAAAAVVLAVVAAAVARYAPRGALLAVVVFVQVLLACCAILLTAVPARVGGAAVASVVGAVGAAVLTAEHPATLGALAGVVGLGVVAAVLGQLVRPERTAVTDVIAAQCAALLLTTGVAALCAVRGAHDGAAAAGLGVLAVGAASSAGALVDRLGGLLARRTRGGLTSFGPSVLGRSLLGAVVALGVAAGLGAALHGADGAILGAVAGAAAVLADAIVAVAAGSRRIAPPLSVLLPYAVAGPALFVVTRVLLG